LTRQIGTIIQGSWNLANRWWTAFNQNASHNQQCFMSFAITLAREGLGHLDLTQENDNLAGAAADAG
jgi:hypothetical protein